MEQLQQFWYSVGAYMMFLIALVSVVWVFYDSIRKNYNAVLWQVLTSLAVIVILPSVVFAALPTLQTNYKAFITPLFWVGLAAGVISIIAVLLYLFRMGVSNQFPTYDAVPAPTPPPATPPFSNPPPAPPTSLPGVINPTAPSTQRTVTQSNRGYTTTLPAGSADNFATAPFSSGSSTQPTMGLNTPSTQPTMRLETPPTSTERTPFRSLPQSPSEPTAPTQSESQTPTVRLDSNLPAPGMMSDPPSVSMTDRTVSIGVTPPSHTDPMMDMRSAPPSETDRTIDMRAMPLPEMDRMMDLRSAPPSETDRTISMSPTGTPSSPFVEPMPRIDFDKMDRAPDSSGGGETRIFGQTATQWAYLVIREGVHRGKTFQLGSVVNIGRRADVNDVVLDDDSISREHARIRFVEGQYILTDLVSSNGTFIQERETGEWKQIHTAELYDKLNLKFGEMILTFFQVKK